MNRTKHKGSGILISFLCICFQCLEAQQDSLKPILFDSLYVTEKKFSQSAILVSNTLTQKEIKLHGETTLSARLSHLPGLSQITTGAISKPVIRGLSGERLQINISGLRIEDQQWEDEYGLGLMTDEAEDVTIIRGPASLLYGSGAMGGVIILGSEVMTAPGTDEHNIGMRLSSNSLGIDIDYGYKRSGSDNLLFGVSLASHGDYTDGEGKRMPNTRYGMYHIVSGKDVKRNHFISRNRARATFSQFGFIADSSDLAETSGSSLSRSFDDAHFSVFSALVNSSNTFTPDTKTEWNVDLGLQSNVRQEMERSKEVEMGLLLNTASLKGTLEKVMGSGWKWTNGIGGMLQLNTNYGERSVIPDAFTGEGSLFSYLNKIRRRQKLTTLFEAGLRYDLRSISTYETESEEEPAADLPVFSNAYGSLNGSVGTALIWKDFRVRGDLSTGFRSGNLAELSANGLHEGSPNWFRGDPDLKPEQCLNGNLSVIWDNNWFSIRASTYYNRFNNYIYLRPTAETVQGYNLFRYEQTRAALRGLETGITLKNKTGVNLSVDYSHLNAKRNNGSWIPFMPADKITADAGFQFPDFSINITDTYIALGTEYIWKQDHVDQDEIASPGYALLNARVGFKVNRLELGLICRNALNQHYYNHLSRLKYYGLFDMGRNVLLDARWIF